MFRGFSAVSLLVAAVLLMAVASPAVVAEGPKPIIIGLDADMSSGAAQSGEAIRRGAELAIAEINQRGGSIERPAVRDALERLPRYKGLVKDYRRPFAPGRHDALTAEDFCLARYLPDGTIKPVGC